MKKFLSLLLVPLLCECSWAYVLLKNDAEYLCQSICLEAGGGAEYDLDTNTCKCRLSGSGIDDADLEMLLKNTETLGLKLATVQNDSGEEIVLRKRRAEDESSSASIEDVESLEKNPSILNSNSSSTESSKIDSDTSKSTIVSDKVVQKRQTEQSTTPATSARFQQVDSEIKGLRRNNNDKVVGQEAPRPPLFTRRTTVSPVTRRTFSLPTRSTTQRSTTKRSPPTPFARRTKPTEKASRFPNRSATSTRSESDQTPLKTLQTNLERMRKEREQRLRNGPKLQQRFGAEARQNLLDQIKERQQQRRARFSSTTAKAPVVGAVHSVSSTTEAEKDESPSVGSKMDIVTQNSGLIDGDNDDDELI